MSKERRPVNTDETGLIVDPIDLNDVQGYVWNTCLQRAGQEVDKEILTLADKIQTRKD